MKNPNPIPPITAAGRRGSRPSSVIKIQIATTMNTPP
jgi:hypothetical protein